MNITKIEKRILKYIANGKSSTYISEKTGYTSTYINNIVNNLLKFNNVKNRAQLIYKLAKEGSI